MQEESFTRRIFMHDAVRLHFIQGLSRVLILFSASHDFLHDDCETSKMVPCYRGWGVMKNMNVLKLNIVVECLRKKDCLYFKHIMLCVNVYHHQFFLL